MISEFDNFLTYLVDNILKSPAGLLTMICWSELNFTIYSPITVKLVAYYECKSYVVIYP